MNIVIVTSGHPPFDERIFYKIGLSLTKHQHKTAIVCSTENIETESEGIKIKGFDGSSFTKKIKIKKLYELIVLFNPSVIICCEPLTILSAHKYKKEKDGKIKIISDITEYYPLKSMLNQYVAPLRMINFLRFFIFNIYASNLADYLFIGEELKSRLYNIIAPGIKKTLIGYYPPLEYFRYSPPIYNGKKFTICYSGIISEARGFKRFLELIKKVSELFPYKIFIAKIVGRYEKQELEKLLLKISFVKNVVIIYKDWVNYKNFSKEFSDVDICIDLRDKNKVFNRSLPIKIFDYMASGKPVIFSNLDSLRGFYDIKKFGLLVEPDDLNLALERIKNYLNNPEQLKEDSMNARRLFEEKYNWEIIERKLIKVINSLTIEN